MILGSDPNDAQALSGMPYYARLALERAGCEVVPVIGAPPPVVGASAGPLRKIAKAILPDAVKRWLVTNASGQGQAVREAAQRSQQLVAKWMAENPNRVDVLLGHNTSLQLAELPASIRMPIIYTSDTTARILFDTYPEKAGAKPDYREASEELERKALHRATRVGMASDLAVSSAVTDFGVPRERVRLVPLGCHLTPGEGYVPKPDAPTRDNLRLLIVASDPVRKRTGFAVNVVEELRRKGVNATLVHIGRPHGTLRSPRVESLGRLRLGVAEDRAKHLAALESSHFSILPSLGEAFGIAPAESALFARPAIVSDTGGLPTVVRQNETGLVLPVNTPPQAWANEIAQLVENPTRYLQMGEAARKRALAEFTWDAYAAHILAMADDCLSQQQR